MNTRQLKRGAVVFTRRNGLPTLGVTVIPLWFGRFRLITVFRSRGTVGPGIGTAITVKRSEMQELLDQEGTYVI